jgi:hypothetical protein
MAEAYSPAPPIDLPILRPQITRYCLSAGRPIDLALDRQFVNTRYRAHQMEFSSIELYLNFSIRSIAREFNIAHCPVEGALLRGYEDPMRADDIENFHPRASTR